METYNPKFNIAAYEGQSKRSAFVLFRDKAKSMTDTLFITQNGSDIANPYIKIKYPYEDFDGFIVQKDGGIINFEIDANVDYKLSMNPQDSTWIKEKSKTGDKYEFYIAKNLSQQMILGHIFVENQHYQLKDTILIGLLLNVDYYIHIPKTTYDIPWRGDIADSDCLLDGQQRFDIPFSTNDEFFEYEVNFKGERWGDVNADERGNSNEADWVVSRYRQQKYSQCRTRNANQTLHHRQHRKKDDNDRQHLPQGRVPGKMEYYCRSGSAPFRDTGV